MRRGIALGLYSQDPQYDYLELLREIRDLGAPWVSLICNYYQATNDSVTVARPDRRTPPLTRYPQRVAASLGGPMTQPLMPKATAVWLIDNTSLTFEALGLGDGEQRFIGLGVEQPVRILGQQRRQFPGVLARPARHRAAIEVAADDGGHPRRMTIHGIEEDPHLAPAQIGVRMALQMDGDEKDVGPGDRHDGRKRDAPADSWLAIGAAEPVPVGVEPDQGGARQRRGREDRGAVKAVAVGAAGMTSAFAGIAEAKLDEFHPVDVAQPAEPLRQLPRRVSLPRAGHAVVHLAEQDDIGANGPEKAGGGVKMG